MNKPVFYIYFILVHLLVGILLLKTDFISRAQTKLGLARNTDELTAHFHTMLAYHQRMDGNVPEQAVILIGDSITQGLAGAALSPFSVNYGIGWDTTRGVLERLPDYQSLQRAKAIVLAIGINDLKRRNNQKIITNYKAILAQLPHNIPVIVSAVLPVSEAVNEQFKHNNQRIIALNTRIQSLCAEYATIHYINAGNALIDQHGNLSDQYHIGDGLHLNTMGYGVWIKALRKVLHK